MGLAWQGYGWQGVAVAVTAIVFWLLLQFNRAVRVMKNAAEMPIGHVDSAVMFQSKLKAGMRLMDIITLTRSLGEKVADDPETYVWRDASAAAVRVELRGGRCTAWALSREDEAAGS